jgi:F-box associated region
MDYGRRIYAFYMCAGCELPYFGGTIACADDAVEGERPSEDRYCPNCVPNGVGCRRLQEHQGLQIFKCRYCCQKADFVCYGTVHFCTPCHDRNSERVRQGTNGTNGTRRPMLTAIHCPGLSCTFPKTNGAVFHENGNSAECEQTYYCAGCESSATSAAVLPWIPPGGPNWIRNPSGESGNIGHWTPQQRGTTWQVETSEDGPNAAHNFVSTYYPCIMSQSVRIVQYVTNPDTVTIEVSARFRGRHDCPSVFRLLVTRKNGLGHTIEQRDTGDMTAPVDAWERTSLILSPMVGTHTITMTIFGQDRQFWAGNFGSKAKDCSVRVLGDNLDGILLPVPPRHGR